MTLEEKLKKLESDYKELDGKYKSALSKLNAYENAPDPDTREKMELLRMKEQAIFYKRLYDMSNKLNARSFKKQESDSEQVNSLKKQLEDSHITIEYLKTIISEKIYLSDDEQLNDDVLYQIFMDISRENGTLKQPKTDDESRTRVRKLYSTGISIRQIAKIEGLSVGLVHKIIHTDEQC